jgi:hypothetical protein
MKMEQEDLDAINSYMEKNGNVTVCPAGERTDPDLIGHVWTRGKPGRPPANAPQQPTEEE